MPPAVRVRLRTPDEAEHLVAPICDLYDEAFSAPPFVWTDAESGNHRKMLLSLLIEPSFGIATAETDNALVGFAYGYTLSPETRWWHGFQEPLPVELTQEWDGRTFALIDLAVQEQWRGQGIGRQLVATLLRSRTEERATLCVQPPATAAQAFYVRLGWRKVGRKDMPPGTVSPVFDVYVVELGTRP